MKKFVAVMLGLMYIPINASDNSWITPTNTVCTSNNGKVDEYGCQASWLNAEKICKESKGRVAPISEFKQIIKDCGGDVKDYTVKKDGNITKNQQNSDYKKCYEKEGFSSNFRVSYLSSSERLRDRHKRKKLVSFYFGRVSLQSTREPTMLSTMYIRCTTTSKWVTVSKKTCKNNAGRMDENAHCVSTYSNAKKICSASNGKLPSKKELNELTKDSSSYWNNLDSSTYGAIDNLTNKVACINNSK